jgi:carbonic anhydrase/acetyltransferase-like protein (isoleucine patch superfamily)
MAIYQLGDRVPQIDPSAFVHESAVVIGAVTLGKGVSVWAHATLRGDNEPIVVGDETNIQECCVLHTDPGDPVTVGARVSVAHQAVLHGCTVGDGCLIGVQAVVLNQAVIGRQCLIGAASLVAERKHIPDNSVVLGSPARVVRELRPQDLALLTENAESYVRRGAYYRTALKRLA